MSEYLGVIWTLVVLLGVPALAIGFGAFFGRMKRWEWAYLYIWFYGTLFLMGWSLYPFIVRAIKKIASIL